MSSVVLDASAVLAVIFNEPGAEKLTDEILSKAIISTVNLAEVQARLVREGVNPEDAWEDASVAFSHAAPFTSEQARIAGSLVTKTRSSGLSLGDRGCLALAISLHAPVYTTDRAWKSLNVGVPIHVIRKVMTESQTLCRYFESTFKLIVFCFRLSKELSDFTPLFLPL